MKFHDLGEVGEEIRKAVIARIRMIFVLYMLFLKYFVQRCGTFFKTVVVVLTAVEIYGETSQGGNILLDKNKWAVVFPVLYVNRISKD